MFGQRPLSYQTGASLDPEKLIEGDEFEIRNIPALPPGKLFRYRSGDDRIKILYSYCTGFGNQYMTINFEKDTRGIYLGRDGLRDDYKGKTIAE